MKESGERISGILFPCKERLPVFRKAELQSTPREKPRNFLNGNSQMVYFPGSNRAAITAESLFLFGCQVKFAKKIYFRKSMLGFPSVNQGNILVKIGVGIQKQLPQSGYCQRTHWAVFLLLLKNAQVLHLCDFLWQIPRSGFCPFHFFTERNEENRSLTLHKSNLNSYLSN